MNPIPQNIAILIEQDRLDEAIRLLNDAISSSPSDDTLIFTRGRLHWRLGHRAVAMADYARAAELCPNGPAARALEQSRDIMAFFNPDLLNP